MYIIFTKGNVKDMEHLNLRCLLQVGPGMLEWYYSNKRHAPVSSDQ